MKLVEVETELISENFYLWIIIDILIKGGDTLLSPFLVLKEEYCSFSSEGRDMRDFFCIEWCFLLFKKES